MSNVLDLVDQTAFLGERATKATNLLQCRLGVQPRDRHRRSAPVSSAISSRGGCRVASNAHRCHSAAIAGSRPAISPTWRSSRRRGRVKNSTPGSSEQANTPLDAEHGPGWHLAVLPFTDGGAGAELRYLPLPHRRRRAVRGVGGRGFRPPTTRSTGLPPGHAGGGKHCARTPAKPRATSPLSAAPSSPRRDSPGVTAAATDLAPSYLARCVRRSSDLTNASLSRRQRSSSMPTSGMPAHTHSEGPATRYSRDWRPGSPSERDGSPQTASPPWRYPSTSAPPAIPAPTPSQLSTSRSTPQPRRRTCARSGPQSSKP